MSVISVFLDKDKYFNKKIKVNKFEINSLADIIRFYLKEVPDIDTIYIAGGCFGKNSKLSRKLVRTCFGNTMLDGTKKYKIYLCRRYGTFPYVPTEEAIKDNHHFYGGVKFDTKRSDHRKMIYFESNKKISAVLIGSTNYSYSSYLKLEASSEADLLMIDNPKMGSINENIINVLKHHALSELDGGGAKFNDYDSLINNVLVSESFNGDGFLQSIFDDLASDSNFIQLD